AHSKRFAVSVDDGPPMRKERHRTQTLTESQAHKAFRPQNLQVQQPAAQKNRGRQTGYEKNGDPFLHMQRTGVRHRPSPLREAGEEPGCLLFAAPAPRLQLIVRQQIRPTRRSVIFPWTWRPPSPSTARRGRA